MMGQQLRHIGKSLFEPSRKQGESKCEDPTCNCGRDEYLGHSVLQKHTDKEFNMN